MTDYTYYGERLVVLVIDGAEDSLPSGPGWDQVGPAILRHTAGRRP